MSKRRYTAGSSVLPVAIMALVLAVLPFLLEPFGIVTALATEIVATSLFALAFNLLLGYTGMVPFGHVAYLGTGAYVAVLAQKYFLRDDIVLSILIGALAALLLGVILGALMMRARGMYFSLLSLCLLYTSDAADDLLCVD